MFRNLTLATFAVGFTLLASYALAADFALGSLTIENPWARPTDPLAKTGAVYFTVKNKGAADKLVSVSSTVADSAMLHQMVNKDGMMTMQHLDAVAVPAGGSAVLKPGGYHVMFVGMKSQLKEGTTFPLTLTFEKAGKVTVQATVQRSEAAPGDKGKDVPKPTGQQHGQSHGQQKH